MTKHSDGMQDSNEKMWLEMCIKTVNEKMKEMKQQMDSELLAI